jgi:hypothetical protein
MGKQRKQQQRHQEWSRYPTQPMSYKKLRRFVDSVIADEKNVIAETFHAAQDHPERGMNIKDVLVGLLMSTWTIEDRQYSSEHRNWKYKIKTTNLSGKDTVILFVAYESQNKIKVITRW